MTLATLHSLQQLTLEAYRAGADGYQETEVIRSLLQIAEHAGYDPQDLDLVHLLHRNYTCGESFSRLPAEERERVEELAHG